MSRALILTFALVLGACNPAGEPPVKGAVPAQVHEADRVWPQPPAAPRIRFLNSFRESRDLGLRPSFFGRLWEVIAGAEVQGMVRPYALAVQNGRLAVADPGLRAVHVFDLEDKAYRRLSEAGGNELRSPVGVAFGPGRLFVADSDRAQLLALDLEGELLFTIEGAERPTGLAYDSAGNRLFVSDTLGHRILVFDENGKSLFSFGRRGNADGEFNYPSHLTLRSGRLYVNDTMNFRLQMFDLDGRHIASFGHHGDGSGDFAQPKGIGVDSEGHVYVADALFDRVQIFESDGSFLLAFGGPGRGPGEFWLPAGLFVDGDRIYVADSYNQRIQVFEFLGGG
jgi:DNA-binding beta-propeller fold protein YncE